MSFPGDSLPIQFLEASDVSLQTTDLPANPPTTGALQYVSPQEPHVGYFTARPMAQDDMKASMYTPQATALPGKYCKISDVFCFIYCLSIGKLCSICYE